MSDHAPDPIDKAYAQAEAVLDDDAARAARRARVLGAVAHEAQAAAAAPAPSRPRLSWARGGWLAAASVAGLSALVALQIDQQAPVREDSPPAETAVAAAPAPATAASPAPDGLARAPAQDRRAQAPAASHAPVAPALAPPPPPPAPAVAGRTEAGASRGSAPADAAPPTVSSYAAPPPPPPPPAPPSAAARSDGLEEVIVSGQRAASSKAEARAAQRAMSPSPAAGARLRAAAAGGRLPELGTLLAQGAAIDAPDEDGETALMKAVQANQPDAAAFLRRRGADLDLKNRAGRSARDMAAAIADPQLNQALGLPGPP